MNHAWIIAFCLLLAGCLDESDAPLPPESSATNGPESTADNRTEEDVLVAAAGWDFPWSLPECTSHGLLGRVPTTNLEPHVPDGYVLQGQGTSFLVLATYECASLATAGGAFDLSAGLALLYTFVDPPGGANTDNVAYLLGMVATSPQVAQHLISMGLPATQGSIESAFEPGQSSLSVDSPLFSYDGSGVGFLENDQGSLQDTLFAYYHGPVEQPRILRNNVNYVVSSQLVHPQAGSAGGLLAELAGAPAFAGAVDDTKTTLALSVA